MTFSQSINSVLVKNYANFGGSASRSEYWWFVLFATLVLIIGGFVIGFVGAVMSLSMAFIFMAFGVMLIALISPMLSVWVRRCHDAGRSTAEAVLVFVLGQCAALATPFGGNLIEFSGIFQILNWSVFGVMVLYTLYLSTKKGTAN